MSAALVLPVSRSRFTRDLSGQRRALGHDRPVRLVVCCPERAVSPPPTWPAEGARDALFLQVPGCSVDGPGVREAIRLAVAELGVDEVLVVAHSHCTHLEGRSAVHPGDGPDMVPDDAGCFIERTKARLARARRRLAAARSRVRDAVGSLAADPLLPSIRFGGIVHIVESGVVLVYRSDRDDFEALL